MTLFDFLQALLPACATFGPAFLVMSGTNERRTRILRWMGAVMLGAALSITWFVTNWQEGRISLLEQRIENLETGPR